MRARFVGAGAGACGGGGGDAGIISNILTLSPGLRRTHTGRIPQSQRRCSSDPRRGGGSCTLHHMSARGSGSQCHAGAWGGQADVAAPLQGAGVLHAGESVYFILLLIVKFCREITHGRALLTVFPRQVKEVEKGQECGLGLDVKFEVLPVSSA